MNDAWEVSLKGERETSCLSCGTKAGRQGMMLMGHGEDDAGTSEAVIDSGDGGGAGELLTKRGGRLEPERFLPWAAGRSSGWQR